MWHDNEYEDFDDEDDCECDEDGCEYAEDSKEVPAAVGADVVLGHGPAVCNICNEILLDHGETCENCAANMCSKCAIPAVDEKGNLIALCPSCSKQGGRNKTT
jgi:hypothetical protein